MTRAPWLVNAAFLFSVSVAAGHASQKDSLHNSNCPQGQGLWQDRGKDAALGQRLGTLLLPMALLLSPLFPAPRGSQLQVTVAPSSTARVGSGALLQCRFDVGGPVALNALRVTWYFWEEKLAWYDQGRSQEQPRASLPSEKELESGDASLSLVVVTVPDGGLYRCVVGYGTQQHQGETILHLLAAPTISIPRQPVVADAETSLLCHVGGFFPKDVDVVWMRDGQVLNDSIRSSPKRNTDGTFNLILTYTFTPTHIDVGSNFSCHIHHEALEQPIEEDVTLDVLVGQTGPRAILILILILVGGGAILVFVIKGRPPMASYFCRKRRKGREAEPREGREQGGRPCSLLLPGAAVARASTRIRPVLVALRTVRAFITFNFWKKRSEGWAVSYNVSEVEGPERCLLGQEGTLRCSMEGTFPEDAVMMWEWIHSEDRMAFESDMDPESPEHQPLLPALPRDWRVTEERAGTRLTSSLTFTPTLQDDRARVRCSVLHDVECIREERVSPEIWLSVTWLRRGKGEDTAVILRDSAECRVEPGTAVLARDGKSFQQETTLTRWTSRDKGAEYICRVGHLALQTPIERSTG
ncbi:signal-regulatory protein beta-1-like [Alligator sinensis]|uniref:Signal-regulatory protein beta-1-like n=1 Tax=Alligator sinensis TaxID=38654 RepID=A0A3Q0FUX9_ALLSI|nr:signal-regulatory protein beta-1-like [Alligator sinensis]